MCPGVTLGFDEESFDPPLVKGNEWSCSANARYQQYGWYTNADSLALILGVLAYPLSCRWRNKGVGR